MVQTQNVAKYNGEYYAVLSEISSAVPVSSSHAATVHRAGPAAPAWSCPRRAGLPAPGADARQGSRGSPATAARWGSRRNSRRAG